MATNADGKVEKFFGVTRTPGLGNANGYLTAYGKIAPQGQHMLTSDRAKAQRAVDAYVAAKPGNVAEVGRTRCYPELVRS